MPDPAEIAPGAGIGAPTGTGDYASGGFGSSFNIFTSVQVYDPVSNSWSAAAPLLYARGYHTATLVSSGKLLLAGGPGSLTAEFYDPSGNTWTAAGTMAVERYQHTATLLSSGNVLVAGGQGASFTILGSAELFDPSSNSWSSAASLAKARRYHTATLLSSGKVLVTGGIDSVGADLASVEIYDCSGNQRLGRWSAAFGNALPAHGNTAPIGESACSRRADRQSREYRTVRSGHQHMGTNHIQKPNDRKS